MKKYAPFLNATSNCKTHVLPPVLHLDPLSLACTKSMTFSFAGLDPPVSSVWYVFFDPAHMFNICAGYHVGKTSNYIDAVGRAANPSVAKSPNLSHGCSDLLKGNASILYWSQSRTNLVCFGHYNTQDVDQLVYRQFHFLSNYIFVLVEDWN